MKLVQGIHKTVYDTCVWSESLQVPIFLWIHGHDWQSRNQSAPNSNLSWYSCCPWPAEPAHMFKLQKFPVNRRHDWQSQSCWQIQRRIPGQKFFLFQLEVVLRFLSMCIPLDSSLEVYRARCANYAVSESWSGFFCLKGIPSDHFSPRFHLQPCIYTYPHYPTRLCTTQNPKDHFLTVWHFYTRMTGFALTCNAKRFVSPYGCPFPAYMQY